jgi:hypothetical protein
MIRATLIILTVSIIGTAATAIANVSASLEGPKSYSIQMNDIGRSNAPLVVENCLNEDCSDTPARFNGTGVELEILGANPPPQRTVFQTHFGSNSFSPSDPVPCKLPLPSLNSNPRQYAGVFLCF